MIPSNSTNRVLQQAVGLIQQKQFQAAIEVLQPLSKQSPKNFEVWNLLGIAAKNSGEMSTAEKAFKRCIRINTKACGAYNNLGNLFIQTKNIEKAIKCYKDAIRINPTFIDAIYNLGITYLEKNDFVLAEKELLRTLKLKPDHASCLASLGHLYQKQEQYKQAIDYYDQALILDSNLVLAIQNKAVIFKIQERYDDAIELFKKVLTINPTIADAYQNLGSTYASIGNTDLAIENFNKAVQFEPLNPSHHHWLNQFLWSVGDENFLTSYHKIIKASPESYNLRRELAYKLTLAERFDEAREQLELLTSQDSKTPMNYKLLGTLLRKQEDFEGAVNSHLQAVKLEPNNIILQEELATSYLSCGDGKTALKIIDRLIGKNKIHQGYWALKATALRIINSDEYHYLHDYEKLVLVTKIETPDGFQSLEEFNIALADELKQYHLNTEHPLDQSLMYGTQSIGDLFANPKGLLKKLKAAFDEQTMAFLKQLPEDPAHPVLSRNKHTFSYTGTWSVMLRNSGFHRNHFHSHGWYSGPYYCALPDIIKDEEQKQGWVKFGEPGFNTTVPLPPDLIVKPEIGMMVRFPSYMWHGTNAFNTDETRLVVALDFEP